MIGSLHGIVELIDGPSLLVNVNGVGYRVHVPVSVLQNAHISEKVDLYTYLHVRDDVLDLFGFPTVEELKVFEMLLSVNGIGPKTALGVFSIGSKNDILSAIQKADVKFFTGVPRLGTKNAQKIIIDLKGKLGSLANLDLLGKTTLEETEITQALKGFGFSQKEVEEALVAIGDAAMESSKKLKLALKYLGK